MFITLIYINYYIITTVEEPCELGCDGMNYCTVFNNRPTDLFRSCSPQADDAAHYDVTLWRQHGTIELFHNELSLRNITKCMPDAWKAVACILQIRPCTRKSQVNKICRQVYPNDKNINYLTELIGRHFRDLVIIRQTRDFLNLKLLTILFNYSFYVNFTLNILYNKIDYFSTRIYE